MSYKYPNLELIEYIFRQYIKANCDNHFSTYYVVEVFRQIWPNTATAFSRPGTCSGQAMTYEYTTIVKMEYIGSSSSTNIIQKNPEAYGVFFGNRLGYIVKNPSKKFFDDWQNRKMESVYSTGIYEYEEKEDE